MGFNGKLKCNMKTRKIVETLNRHPRTCTDPLKDAAKTIAGSLRGSTMTETAEKGGRQTRLLFTRVDGRLESLAVDLLTIDSARRSFEMTKTVTPLLRGYCSDGLLGQKEKEGQCTGRAIA